MENFRKWGIFLMAMVLLFIVWYDVKENKKIRDIINKNSTCTDCNGYEDPNGGFSSGDYTPSQMPPMT